MRKNVVKILALLVVGALVVSLSASEMRARADDEEGDITNQDPYATGTDSNQIETSKPEYDNSGSDVLTLYFTFKDNNSEADIVIGTGDELIVYYEPSADNNGFSPGTDTFVIAFDLSTTQTAGDCWIDSNGGATNGSNDDGTQTDGYFEIEDENDDDDNFEYTIPGGWSTSDYYAAQINFSDEGSNVISYTPNFKVKVSITYTLVYANGNYGPSYWGEWSATPTDNSVPGVNGVDTATIAWLLVNNSGSDPSQQFTVSSGAENFTGQTHSRWINIDYNINWTFYECGEDPGGLFDPDDVDWEEKNWTADDDADGDYTFTFSALGNKMWVIYCLHYVTEDDGEDTTPVAAHNYDNVLRDDQYMVTFAVVAI